MLPFVMPVRRTIGKGRKSDVEAIGDSIKCFILEVTAMDNIVTVGRSCENGTIIQGPDTVSYFVVDFFQYIESKMILIGETVKTG